MLSLALEPGFGIGPFPALPFYAAPGPGRSGATPPSGAGTRPLSSHPAPPLSPPAHAAAETTGTWPAADLLVSLSRILETRDPQTYYHSFRVSRYALCLAIALGWPDEQQRVLEAGAWLHDIGKLGVPETILRKAGPLTPAEYQVVQTHVAHGIYILQGVTPLTPFLPYVAYHHEWYDGRGYPFGLIGTDIPIEGRLLTVADAFDALTSPRSYRTATAPDEALGILRGAAGSQFDPQIIAVVDSAGLPDAADEVRTWGSEDWH